MMAYEWPRVGVEMSVRICVRLAALGGWRLRHVDHSKSTCTAYVHFRRGGERLIVRVSDHQGQRPTASFDHWLPHKPSRLLRVLARLTNPQGFRGSRGVGMALNPHMGTRQGWWCVGAWPTRNRLWAETKKPLVHVLADAHQTAECEEHHG